MFSCDVDVDVVVKKYLSGFDDTKYCDALKKLFIKICRKKFNKLYPSVFDLFSKQTFPHFMLTEKNKHVVFQQSSFPRSLYFCCY
jgi:hypothetical protein